MSWIKATLSFINAHRHPDEVTREVETKHLKIGGLCLRFKQPMYGIAHMKEPQNLLTIGIGLRPFGCA